MWLPARPVRGRHARDIFTSRERELRLPPDDPEGRGAMTTVSTIGALGANSEVGKLHGVRRVVIVARAPEHHHGDDVGVLRSDVALAGARAR
jgi:hypothetical protein